MIHKPIYSLQSLFVQRNKEKVAKTFFYFKLLTLDYNCRKGFLRPQMIVIFKLYWQLYCTVSPLQSTSLPYLDVKHCCKRQLSQFGSEVLIKICQEEIWKSIKNWDMNGLKELTCMIQNYVIFLWFNFSNWLSTS